jgi:succinoglycan biosynthesis transport protein ExoP
MNMPQAFDNDPRDLDPRSGRHPSLPVTRSSAVATLGWDVGSPPPNDLSGRVSLAAFGRALVKHIGLIALGLAIGLAVGAAVTLMTRPSYTAKTTLQIDREAEKVVSTGEQTPLDNLGEEFFQTQYGLLRSRALSIRVAESLGLTHDEKFVGVMTASRPGAGHKPESAEQKRDRVISLLQSNEGVTPERGSRLVAVTFSSPDPALSAKVANAYAENFITAALDRRFESSSYARDFLEKRIAQVKAKLEESERDLVAYAASQQIIQLPNAGQPNAAEAGPSLAGANLESFNTALAAARTERIKAEQKWRQAQATTGVGLNEILQSPTFQILSQEHAKQVAEYQDKLRVFKPDYPEMLQQKARLEETQRQLDLEAANVRQALRAQYEAALANEKALGGQVNNLKGAVLDLRGRSIRYTILQREVDTNRTLYDGLLQRYKEVGVAGGVASNNISVVDRAEAPAFPSSPRPVLNMALAALAGLLLGAAMAVVREALDQAIRTPADFEAGLDVPLLGSIPVLKKGLVPKVALADNRSAMSEAFQSLRSALQFSTADGFPKTLLVTSPWPRSGKTTTAFAVSQFVARLGFRVLLIDADLRNPSVQALVGVDGGLGLSSLLTGAAVLKETVQSTAYVNLFAVTAGPHAPNPAELLAGPRIRALLEEAGAVFDMIVIDGPPIMGLADAPMIGSVVAGSLLVVEAGRTTRAQVRLSLRRMGMGGANVVGGVLNKCKQSIGSYGYGYGYGYGEAYGAGEAAAPGGLTALASRARRLIAK